MSDTGIILTVAGLVLSVGLGALGVWLRQLHVEVREIETNTIGRLRDYLDSRVNELMCNVAKMSGQMVELDHYIKHNATDLWAKRDVMADQLAKLEGRLDHVTSELIRTSKELEEVRNRHA